MISPSAGPVVIGIDAGTTSVKSVAFDLSGSIVSIARSSVHPYRDATGAAEVDMDEIWDAAAATIRDVMQAVVGREVLGVGLTGQGDGAWLLDRAMRPLRPAALWVDGRAGDRVREWSLDGRAAAVQQATGSPLFPGAVPVLIDELSVREPDLIDGLGAVLNCKDWLRFRLTGEVATDPSDASRGYLDTETFVYSERLLSVLGHERIGAVLPEVRAPHASAGRITSAAAAETALPVGVPVAIGLVDTAAAAVGLDAIGDGEGYAVLGTTAFVGINHPSRHDLQTDVSIVLATGRGTQVLECLAPMNGTPNLDWARNSVGWKDRTWAEIEADVREVSPGAAGLLYLPYGSPSGERAPFVDHAASAAWLGLSVMSSPAEMLRSVCEGLAFAMTECMDLLQLGDRISMSGGGADSDLLCQIIADVSGRQILRPDAEESGARGAASLALIAAGEASSLVEAIDMLRCPQTAFNPDPATRESYAASYTTFVHVRDALRPHWAALRVARSSSSSR